MEIKILQVFYGKDGLPYKDKDRQVHFPIAGTGFLGASNTTKIKFYYDELDNLDETTWVAVSKLPNGKVGSRVLESHLDSELNEHYALLELDNYYTQYKGDVFISLQGYQGGVDFDYDEENSQYEIHGTPTIAVTGSIKFTINYANQFVGSGETDNINFQRILAALGTKLGMRAYSEHVEELPSEGSPDVFYVVNDDPNDPNKANIYVWNENTKHYIWVGDNTLDLGEYYTKTQGEQFEDDIDDRVSRVESELSSVVSGSPKGVYATLSDLESAYPTGTDGIYVVSADGHWYYWNSTNSEWTDGGVYQATEIADGSVTKEKINADFVKNLLLDNKFLGKIVVNEQSIETKPGIYTGIDTYDSSFDYYNCVKVNISNCDCLDFDVLQGSSVAMIYYKTVDNIGGFIDTQTTGHKHLDLSNVTEIAFNFYGSEYCADYIVTKNNVKNTFTNKILVNKSNLAYRQGLYFDFDNYNGTYTSHECSYTLKATNLKKITFYSKGYAIPDVVWKDNNYIIHSSTTNVQGMQTIDVSDAMEIAFNFFDKDNVSYEIELKDQNGYCKTTNILTSKIRVDRDTFNLIGGIYFSFDSFQASTQHKCTDEIAVENIKSISYTSSSGQGVPFFFWKNRDGTTGTSGQAAGTYSYDLSNAIAIKLNFAEDVDVYYIIERKTQPLNKYNDYNTKGLVFNNTKSALFCGDSITVGFTTGGSITPNGYPKLFSDKYGMTYWNEAVGGAEYCNDGEYQGTPIPKMLTQITNSTHKSVDYLFIAGGTNDWQGQNDLATFKQAVSDTLDYALANYTGQIILITPINTTTSFSATPKIYSLQEYRNIITEVAISKNSPRITVVQGNLFDFPDETNSASFISAMFGDGLHPSELGYATAYLYGLVKAIG